ncbi:hypothetical protein Scep_002419 [Stephania cephalantha]|uniref:GDSL esterase/lipase n=1 Tax=Stephania cephalantha TaxID=152367 RepID=A0AAP0Q4Y7_9MAGN
MALLLYFVPLLLNHAYASSNCDFPAIFNFGDSNSDTGGYGAAFQPPTKPNGETFFRRPIGRFSDGRLIIDFLGGVFDYLLPKKDYYSRALYTFDIGHNDMTAALFANMSISEVRGLIPYMVGNLSATVKSVYNEGEVPPSQIDSAGCAIPYNNLSQFYNDKLREAVLQLRRDLPLAAIIYVDIYSVKYSLISQAHKYGFEKPLVACCGYGGDQFNYSPQAQCGGTIKANGGQVFVGSCDKPSVRVNWDGVHYTEAANKFVFDQIVNGNFSDPPVSLRMACHRKAN